MRHKEAKYIVIKVSMSFGYEREAMFIFDRACIHKVVALALTQGKLEKVVSAGFCTVEDDNYFCYGESESLRVMSRPEEDRYLLEEMLGVDRW